MLKIKKEKKVVFHANDKCFATYMNQYDKNKCFQREKVDGEGGLDSDESDWEPEAEILPPEREQTRSGRQRKRPSFFQEFESQENNLDNILQEFEQTQVRFIIPSVYTCMKNFSRLLFIEIVFQTK